MKNRTASTIVTLCKTKSIPRAFCFPKSCSAPPEMAPERPALFPDCNNTTTINAIATMTSKALIMRAFIPPPDKNVHNISNFTKKHEH